MLSKLQTITILQTNIPVLNKELKAVKEAQGVWKKMKNLWQYK